MKDQTKQQLKDWNAELHRQVTVLFDRLVKQEKEIEELKRYLKDAQNYEYQGDK